ncbi:hypothetical protein DFJ63DRAFT_338076 [Scheffersomyces coipomensis]|uniref:uncharacterized protein n=1 Tax=Scheffersomyces coipomensis TaxID=1788519 RepID=UPI00315CEE2A
MTVKRLHIRASNNYNLEDSIVIPINTNNPIEINSPIGTFKIIINIKQFDGSNPHQSNSLTNINDSTYLNHEPIDSSQVNSINIKDTQPNLRIDIVFKPSIPISGSELIFGNDFTVPIRNYVPTTILATGLKFFTWFINKTVKGDIYSDKPYLYGLVLNSFTNMSIIDDNDEMKIFSDEDNSNSSESISDSSKPGILRNPLSRKKTKKSSMLDRINHHENLNDNIDNTLKIPNHSIDRIKFFTNIEPCQEFIFTPNDTKSYFFQFDTDFVKLANSSYAVSIPTYWNKTFDINVSSFANDNLNNFNWVIKQGGYDGVDDGIVGLIINFALLDEEEEEE